MRDRLRRGLTPDRRHERPVYTGEEIRELHGSIAALGLTPSGTLVVKILPHGGGGKLLGKVRWVEEDRIREEEGAWIVWSEPFETFSFHQPQVGDPVVVTYTGNRPTDGRAGRVGRNGAVRAEFATPRQNGLFKILSAVGVF